MSVIISRALPDVRDGLKPSQRRILVAMNDLGLAPESSTTQVRRHRRRDDEALSSARRRGHLSDAGAHGPGLEPAPSADPSAGQLRLHRRPAPRGHALHRGQAVAHRRGDARRPRARDRRFHRQLRRQIPRTARPAEQVPQPARQRLRRHRRRHGHRNSAAQPRRGLQRPHPAHRRPRRHRRSADRDHSRAPISRPAASSAAGRASSTATAPAAARSRCGPGPTSTRRQRIQIIIHEVPYQQTRNRLREGDRRPGQGRAHQGHQRHPRRIQRPQRRAGRPRHLPQDAMPIRSWCSISSTSSRRCRRPSASSCWPWSTAGRDC